MLCLSGNGGVIPGSVVPDFTTSLSNPGCSHRLVAGRAKTHARLEEGSLSDFFFPHHRSCTINRKVYHILLLSLFASYLTFIYLTMKGDKKNRAREQRGASNAASEVNSAANEHELTSKSSGNATPNSQILGLVSRFLSTHGYDKAAQEISGEDELGSSKWSGQSKKLPELEQIFAEWQESRTVDGELPESVANILQRSTKQRKATETSDDDSSSSDSDSDSASDTSDSSSDDDSLDTSDDSSDDDSLDTSDDSSDDDSLNTSDDSSDDSDGDSDESLDDSVALTTSALAEVAGAPTASNNVTASLKRKRPSSTESSSSNSDDTTDTDSSEDDSSDSEDAPPFKKSKTAASSDSSDTSDSDSSSDDDSDSDDAAPANIPLPASDTSDSDSSSDDDSDSDDAAPADIALPASDTSDSESDSDSDSSSADSDATSEKSAPTQPTTNETSSADERKESSDSSVTLAQTSPDLGPVPAKRKRSTSPEQTTANGNFKYQKKGPNTPFSRISSDQFVDPRFASNAYVSYDYADKAHQDLIVTKGKGFTKEKNKKKRGAYRGGMIDMAPKGIKFDD